MIDETKKQLEKNSTKGKAEAVASVIQYQQRKDVKSISIKGAEDLAEVSRDEFNHVTIEMKRDDTKENRLESTNTDLLEIERQKGTEPTLLHPKHDATKEQVLKADNNLIEITNGTNGTNEYTKLLVPHDENKVDEITVKESSKDMLKVVESKEGEHPNIIKQLELELDLPIFWFTWGEYYDYVTIYALGNTVEKYKGYADFLEDPVEGWYNEERNATIYIFGTNQDNYNYNSYITLRDLEENEVYRVIARSADIEQVLKYAPDYVKGNYDEEGLNINDRHNQLKDEFESYVKVLGYSWDINNFSIFTKGDSTNVAYAYFSSYNNAWGTDRIKGVYYEEMDATVYTLPNKGDTLEISNLAITLADYNNNVQFYTQNIKQADYNQTNVKAEDYIKNKPVINNIDPSQFPISVYQSWNGTKYTLRLYGNTVGVFNVRGQLTNITGSYNSSYNYTQYEMDLATWSPFSSGVLYVQKGTGGLAYLSIYLTQPDWNETDSKQPDFIKNKPDVLLNSLNTDDVSKVDRVIQDTETINDLYQKNIDLMARVEALENA